MRLFFQIAMTLFGAANMVLGIYLWRQARKDEANLRRTFWQSTMSGNESFLIGIMFLAMGGIFPATGAFYYWLAAGIFVSSCIIHYPRYRDSWKRKFSKPLEINSNVPERVPNS